MNMNPTPLTLTFYKSLGITRHKSLYIQICAYLHVNHTCVHLPDYRQDQDAMIHSRQCLIRKRMCSRLYYHRMMNDRITNQQDCCVQAALAKLQGIYSWFHTTWARFEYGSMVWIVESELTGTKARSGPSRIREKGVKGYFEDENVKVITQYDSLIDSQPMG